MAAAGPSQLSLRLPRALLDPDLRELGCGDADGLVAVRLQLSHGCIAAITPHPAEPTAVAPLPLAITPPVDPHVHLDKAFSWPDFPNRDGTMAAALALNLREGQQRTLAQVLERGERALELAWRYGLRAMRSHVDSLGPWSETCWEVLSSLRQRWAGRVDLELVALVPIQHWLSEAGERQARQVYASSRRCLL
jgi:cytosine deaminase